MDRIGIRQSGPLVSIVAAATDAILFILGTATAQRAIIRKIMVMNHQAAPITLQIGFTTLGAVFTPVLPDLYCINGIESSWTEEELPICGNTPEGFQADATAVTGTLGNIIAQASAAGAIPLDIEVRIEVEVF